MRALVRNEFRVGDVRHCFSDIALAQRELAFARMVTLEDGMVELVRSLACEEAEDHVVGRHTSFRLAD